MTRSKKLTMGKTVSSISIAHENEYKDRLKVKSVYCLLGGYNEVGRNIDLDTFIELQNRFNEIVKEVSNLI